MLNPGLHALCFRGNQRGSEGYEEHISGIGLLSSTIKEYQRTLGVTTKFLLHNVLWANENGLFDFYAKRVRVTSNPSRCHPPAHPPHRDM